VSPLLSNRAVTRSTRSSIKLLPGALGGTRTPNLLIRRLKFTQAGYNCLGIRRWRGHSDRALGMVELPVVGQPLDSGPGPRLYSAANLGLRVLMWPRQREPRPLENGAWASRLCVDAGATKISPG